MNRPMRLFLLALSFLCAGPALAAGQAEGGYKVLQEASLPGDGGWDFLTVDGTARRVYITHDNKVQVLDADTLKLLGTLADIPRPHGVALVPGLDLGYVTSGDPGSVAVFKPSTLERLADIPASKDADVVLYDPYSKHVFTFNGDSQNATVIDPKTGKVVGTIDLGGSPEVAVSDGKGRLFDNLSDKNMVLRINAKTLKITGRWPIAPGGSATGMAIDLKTKRLFIGCRNKWLVVMDAVNGHVVASLPIGDHVDSTVFDPGTGNVYDSCGDGTLSVIHEDSADAYHVVENAATVPGARTMALDPKTGHLFLDAAKSLPPEKPTKEEPKPRRKNVPGSFKVFTVGR